MDSSVNKKSCPSKKCQAKPKSQNGKGDKPRPVSQKKYNKNYESINWKK